MHTQPEKEEASLLNAVDNNNQSCEDSDGSLEYINTIWNLLMAYPEAVMTCGGLTKRILSLMKQQRSLLAAATDMPWPPDEDL